MDLESNVIATNGDLFAAEGIEVVTGRNAYQGGEQHDRDQGTASLHLSSSCLIGNKIGDARRPNTVAEYAALIIVVMQLCTVGTNSPAKPQKNLGSG